MGKRRERRNVKESVCRQAIAIYLYSQAVGKAVGVNDENQPDYKAIAKECVEKADEAAIYLFVEMERFNKANP